MHTSISSLRHEPYCYVTLDRGGLEYRVLVHLKLLATSGNSTRAVKTRNRTLDDGKIDWRRTERGDYPVPAWVAAVLFTEKFASEYEFAERFLTITDAEKVQVVVEATLSDVAAFSRIEYGITSVLHEWLVWWNNSSEDHGT